MKIIKFTLTILLAASLVIVSLNGQAALTNGAVLEFDSSQYTCSVGGVYPNCDYSISEIDMNGSWSGFDLPRDGVIDPIDRAEIIAGVDGGIIISEIQLLNEIEQSWSFLGVPSSGHYTTSPISVVNDFGLTKELDFSGWTFGRGDGVIFDLGGDASFGDTGLASITCESAECANGERFALDYTAHLPADFFDDGYSGILYELHLVGSVSSVPVPAAVWLFGSGLIALMGFMRKR